MLAKFVFFFFSDLNVNWVERVEKIETRLREKLDKIVRCDLYRTNPVYPHGDKYAVVFSSLCMEFAAADDEDYLVLLKNAANLVEKGGFLVMQVSKEKKFA